MKWIRIFKLTLLIFLSASALAKTKEFCGKREGTAGNAYLVDKNGREVITLATQGVDSALLDQADELVGKNSGVKGEEGTQVGTSYCVTAELDKPGEPVKIVRARLKK